MDTIVNRTIQRPEAPRRVLGRHRAQRCPSARTQGGRLNAGGDSHRAPTSSSCSSASSTSCSCSLDTATQTMPQRGGTYASLHSSTAPTPPRSPASRRSSWQTCTSRARHANADRQLLGNGNTVGQPVGIGILYPAFRHALKNENVTRRHSATSRTSGLQLRRASGSSICSFPARSVGAEARRQRASYTPAAPHTSSRSPSRCVWIAGAPHTMHTATAWSPRRRSPSAPESAQTARRKRGVQPAIRMRLPMCTSSPTDAQSQHRRTAPRRCRSPQPRAVAIDRLTQPCHVGHRHCLMGLRAVRSDRRAVIAQVDVRLKQATAGARCAPASDGESALRSCGEHRSDDHFDAAHFVTADSLRSDSLRSDSLR